MRSSSRSDVVSSFTIIKGAMVEETYAVFASWNLAGTKRENLDRLRSENFIGANSNTWLRDIAKVINRRFDPDKRDRALVLLAKNGCELDVWKPALLWHITRDEFLLRDFLQNWMFPAYDSGVFHVRPEELHTYLKGLRKRGAITEHDWSEQTIKRVAAGLLKIATEFGLLRGGAVKEFATYHLPEQSFLYLLHAMREERQGLSSIVTAADWRMFLMRPADVEREILRLHQFRKLDYQVAGSLVQLSLPCESAVEYAQRMVA
jgi:hypothetical protein